MNLYARTEETIFDALNGTRFERTNQRFEDDEKLFRRVPPDYFDGETLVRDAPFSVDVIKLPDISVDREKFGGSAALARKGLPHFGVVSFLVGEIPSPYNWHAITFKFDPVFCPQSAPTKNLAHSEIQVFDSGGHLTWESGGELDETLDSLQMFWRLDLLEKLKEELPPGEKWVRRS